MKYSPHSAYGAHFLNSFPSMGGRVFFVMAAADTRYDMVANIVKTDPDGKTRLYNTIEAAYDAAVTNSHDTIYYFPGAAGQTLTAAVTWSKNYVHLIGVAAPVVRATRARIFAASTQTDAVLWTVSGTGCIFKNIYIFYGVNSAAALGCVKVTGQRNYFEGCHFAGIGNDTQDAANAYSLMLDGAAENRFVECAIGLDTIARGTAANSEILVDSAATRNYFKDCQIYAQIEHATNHPLVKLADTTAIDRDLTFDNCLFNHFSVNYATTQGGIFQVPAITQGYIIVKNCVGTSGSSSATKWDVNDNNKIELFNAPTPAEDTAGLIRNV